MRRPSPKGPVEMTIQQDRKRDRWVCDGKEVKAIDDDNQTYEVVQIPPNQRGENIMDGPLPFLFGMPPEKAKARYQFKLLGEDDKNYAIQVRPKWKQDAVDWTQAELLLTRKTCLPAEVHLHNAAGTSETVYYFSDLQINRSASSSGRIPSNRRWPPISARSTAFRRRALAVRRRLWGPAACRR